MDPKAPIAPAVQAWRAFATDNPSFGLTGTAWSWTHFRREHGAELERAGIARRLPGRHWVVDADRFPAAVRAVLLGAAIPQPE